MLISMNDNATMFSYEIHSIIGSWVTIEFHEFVENAHLRWHHPCWNSISTVIEKNNFIWKLIKVSRIFSPSRKLSLIKIQFNFTNIKLVARKSLSQQATWWSHAMPSSHQPSSFFPEFINNFLYQFKSNFFYRFFQIVIARILIIIIIPFHLRLAMVGHFYARSSIEWGAGERGSECD